MRHYLLVDDNEEFAENIAEIIRDMGAEVTVVTNGHDAVERVRRQRFDALITDMRMPLMSGAGLVHMVRRIDPGLPAMVITAFTGDDDLAAARNEGLLAVLPKPVPIERLLSLAEAARRDGLVVIVDDDVALTDNLSEILRDKGFSAVTAATVIETDRVGPVAPFAALVDLRVPGGPDGEAYQRLRMKFPHLPQLVITAYAEHMPPIDAPKVYRKPFDSSMLLSDLEAIYERRSRA